MTAHASPRLLPAAVAVAGCLLIAVVAARPEPVAVAAPFALLLVLGLAVHREPELRTTVVVEPRTLSEGDELTVTVTVAVSAGAGWVELQLHPPAVLQLVDGDVGWEEAAGPGATVAMAARFTSHRWGTTGPFTTAVIVHDRLRLVTHRSAVESAGVRVRPSAERLRSLAAQRVLRPVPGSHPSRHRGDGIDFADIRPFVPGDRVRSVNWRASARRGELWINDRQPDRSGDVVLFLDTFETAGEGTDSTLQRCVEAAATLAAAHLGANDRVGLVDMGGLFRWVRPAGGTVQLHRIVDVLVGTQVLATSVDKSIDVLPMRALPRRSLVIALSPLLDRRGVAALEALRARGFDLVVVECSPEPHVRSGPGRRGDLAHRLWLLDREALRVRFRQRGVAVVEWPTGTEFDLALREALAFRHAVLR
nr:DUF58 domain-containing protein [Actinomycetota bacterium]